MIRLALPGRPGLFIFAAISNEHEARPTTGRALRFLRHRRDVRDLTRRTCRRSENARRLGVPALRFRFDTRWTSMCDENVQLLRRLSAV